MDSSKPTLGELVAAVSGLLLFASMFLGWYGVEAFPGSSGSAWQVFALVDLLLFAAALTAVTLVVLRAANSLPELPVPIAPILLAAGACAVALVLLRLVFPPQFDALLGVDSVTTRKLGVFLALLASVGMALGGYLALNERGGADSRTRRARAGSPPPSTGGGGGST